jgi:hypothetical protein
LVVRDLGSGSPRGTRGTAFPTTVSKTVLLNERIEIMSTLE